MTMHTDAIEPVVLRDLLLLIGIETQLAEVERWTPEQHAELEAWAAAMYLRANDNPVRVPERPAWFTQAMIGGQV